MRLQPYHKRTFQGIDKFVGGLDLPGFGYTATSGSQKSGKEPPSLEFRFAFYQEAKALLLVLVVSIC
jgi:hypothetical protein